MFLIIRNKVLLLFYLFAMCCVGYLFPNFGFNLDFFLEIGKYLMSFFQNIHVLLLLK